MTESVSYQAILQEGEEKGRLKEARRALIRAGTRRLGTPTRVTLAQIENIDSLEQWEVLFDRVFNVETWNELNLNGQ